MPHKMKQESCLLGSTFALVNGDLQGGTANECGWPHYRCCLHLIVLLIKIRCTIGHLLVGIMQQSAIYYLLHQTMYPIPPYGAWCIAIAIKIYWPTHLLTHHFSVLRHWRKGNYPEFFPLLLHFDLTAIWQWGTITTTTCNVFVPCRNSVLV